MSDPIDYFDPEWNEWVPTAAIPYQHQRRPKALARLAVMTIFRRYRCQAKWWCSWSATEQGGTCDQHEPDPLEGGTP